MRKAQSEPSLHIFTGSQLIAVECLTKILLVTLLFAVNTLQVMIYLKILPLVYLVCIYRLGTKVGYMKTPERSCTSRVRHFNVLLPI